MIERMECYHPLNLTKFHSNAPYTYRDKESMKYVNEMFNSVLTR